MKETDLGIDELDVNTQRLWAITLQIPSFKKVNIQGTYQAYAQFEPKQQKEYLFTCFNEAHDKIVHDSSAPRLYFEEHKDKRLHAHTYLTADYDTIYAIQQIFCKDIIKIRPKQFQQVFNLFKPDNAMRWMKYCKKHSSLSDLEADLLLLPDTEIII